MISKIGEVRFCVESTVVFHKQYNMEPIIMACREGGTEGGREEEGGRVGTKREGEGRWRKREGHLRVGYATV